MDGYGLLVRKDDLSATEVVPEAVRPPGDGEVTLEVERFALGQINVTYARLGDALLPFWNAFPAPAGRGRVPVWGFARVVASRHPSIAEGSRWFGFLPIGTHHTLAVEPSGAGFVDPAPERAFLHPWYRTYQPAGAPSPADDLVAVARPVFPASYLLDEFLGEHAAAGARTVVITSASSRTALGLAELLEHRGDLTVVGVTSRRNWDFVAGRGIYDVVASYDDLARLPITTPAVLVDFTGDPKLLREIHEKLGDGLQHSALVGYTSPDAVVRPDPMPGPEPRIFFTPAIESETIAREGAESFYARYHAAEARFVARAASWCAVRPVEGLADAADVFRALVAGDQRPAECHIVSPQ
ncbi:DUF2855 family protein [Amycolatopsis sp. A133]|uniref:DUF2855 family protein n=1 Tax=Amycolatopsis sp. A133 TaxID=3064472 RepID=UPI0027ED828B|nr:DUF2855 family protein [Amycolatopsis sp. A133]MDQ7806755.1 DUF2855 family protein [Amycolatopsis sp. A133]